MIKTFDADAGVTLQCLVQIGTIKSISNPYDAISTFVFYAKQYVPAESVIESDCVLYYFSD
jgi:hypothetical protein